MSGTALRTGVAGRVQRSAAGLWMRSTWWVRVLLVYAGARAWSALVLMIVAQQQVATRWTGAKPSYLEYVGLMWDSSWYRQVAEHGYPSTFPLDYSGHVLQNAWAFFPLFPALVRGFMVITGGPWYVLAPVTATLLGAAAMLGIHRLIVTGAPRAVAAYPSLPLVTVLLVSVFPSSIVFQTAYTESLALLLIAASLTALVARRYGLTAVLVLALGFTRAVALPMAIVVVVHTFARWRATRRGQDKLTRYDGVGLAGLAVAAAVSGFAWPTICGWVTGQPDGYLQTQSAWRGTRNVVPVVPWWYATRFWFHGWAIPVLVVAAVVVILLVRSPSSQRLGPELRAWSPAYLGYLVAVIEPGTSLFRFLLLAFPMAAITAGLVTHRWRRVWVVALVVVMLGLQVVWAFQLWRLVPPAGWPP
jgi:hypothetical protein